MWHHQVHQCVSHWNWFDDSCPFDGRLNTKGTFQNVCRSVGRSAIQLLGRYATLLFCRSAVLMPLCRLTTMPFCRGISNLFQLHFDMLFVSFDVCIRIHDIYFSISIQYSLALHYSFSPRTMCFSIRDKTFVQLYYIENVIMIFVSFFLETFLLFWTSAICHLA
jgi:hypothetical protein